MNTFLKIVTSKVSLFFRGSNPERLEKSILTITTFVLILGLYALLSNSFWLQYVPLLGGKKEVIGSVINRNGQTLRKIQNDTLWLPLDSKNAIYNNDLIMTQENSTLEINMKASAKFSIGPETLVRIRLSDGKPLIHLQKGSFKAELATDQEIKLLKGSRVEKLKVKKGSYVVENKSSFGVQIAREGETLALDGSNPYISESSDESAEGADETLSEENDQLSTPTPQEQYPSRFQGKAKPPKLPKNVDHSLFDLPSPQDNTIFLVRTKNSIPVGAVARCPDECQLIIYYGKAILKNFRFSSGDVSIGFVDEKELKFGDYRWQYTSLSFEKKGNFSVLEYSEEAIEKAIINGYPIEVMN